MKTTVQEILRKNRIVVSTFHHEREIEWNTYDVEDAKKLLSKNKTAANGFRYSVPAWFTENDYELSWNLQEAITGRNRPFPA